ncbi:MAG: hypothetical protein LBH29_04965 [Elusimicrobiota bacterium]|jgi:predicted hotdog family 3-hydroxylacyl-ACP dehydratase|nr:hypothetical protein [Elusimicrobiota bacterium]
MLTLESFNLSENMFHKAPMLLVDKILEENTESGRASFKILNDSIFIDKDGYFSRAALIDFAAQSLAAVDIFQKQRDALKIKKGFLASVKNFSFYKDAKAGDTLLSFINRTDNLAGIHIVCAEIFKNSWENLIAKGEIRIYEFE